MAIGSPQWMYSSGEYEIDQSLKFNDDDSAYLSWTPSSASNRRTWTWSGWFKRGNVNSSATRGILFSSRNDGSNYTYIGFDDGGGGYDRIRAYSLSGGSVQYDLESTAQYRDVSGWYHLVVSIDTTQGTSSNRVKLYINGEQITAWSTSTYPSQNVDTFVNATYSHRLSQMNDGSYYDGYLAEVNFIDGQALTPADFGTTGTYGEWKPKEYSGSYGTNGFYLPFKQDYTVEGFSTVTWKNTAPMYVGGVGFKSDLIWTKSRAVQGHAISDAITGFDRYGQTNSTNDFYTPAEVGGNLNPTADGFTTNTGWHSNGHSYVGWNWDMGGSNATNTDGSITSTVRANTTYGQSIVSYTGNATNGATVGHGLSSSPEMLLVKNKDNATDWFVYHTSAGASKYLLLNSDAAEVTNTSIWQNTAPSSSVVTLGDAYQVNGSHNMIMYAFHSVTGYSKFGSYTGNGSTTGTTVTLGFRPAFVLLKPSSAVDHWNIYDTTRDPQNPINHLLFPNRTNAEGTGQDIEISDTGFQLKTTNTGSNGNGTTYIYMAFADKREYAYWLDQSGNNNDWTSNNLTESDISVDSPSNNFATIDPLSSGAGVFSEGNLKYVSTSDTGVGTLGISSGKAYAEVTVSSASNSFIGVCDISQGINPLRGGNWADHGGIAYKQNGDQYSLPVGGSSATASYGASYTNGDIIGIAFDVDANTITFYKNGVSQGNTTNGLSHISSNGVYSIMVYGTTTFVTNFGQDSSFAGNKVAQGNQDSNDIGDFYYTPPTGFLALCTKNLPDVAVVPQENFNTVLYTGTSGTHSETVGLTPDLTWIKQRSSTRNHVLHNAVVGYDFWLYSNLTNAEGGSSGDDRVERITNGITLRTANSNTNLNNETYVAWNWKANGSGSSNTDGTINTTATSANVDAGFSISTYTGTGSNATIGHGLSKAPEMLIIKNREAGGTGSGNWNVFVTVIDGSMDELALNKTDAKVDRSITAPTSSVFSVDTSDERNQSGIDYIAYCFHSVDGYSKVGSYTGNGSTDGTFVYTGFRPAFVMVKSSSAIGHWEIHDTTRDVSNVSVKRLFPNYSNAEDSDGAWDILSNGFKFRTTHSSINASGASQIYIAFAETPFKYSNAR